MKIMYAILLIGVLGSCKKESKAVEPVVESAISKDSVVALIDSKWKFATPQYAPQNYSVMNNWNEWRQLLLLLENKPAKSLRAIKAKISEVNKQVQLLETSIPEGYMNRPVLSRINLLKTHISQLDMYLEISSLPHKEIVSLLENIQKDIVAVVLQFEEVQVRKTIPKEEDEPVKIIVDTDRKATLNAWE